MFPINQVLQGDCTRVLRMLPNEVVVLVVTDPPYGVRYEDAVAGVFEIARSRFFSCLDPIHVATQRRLVTCFPTPVSGTSKRWTFSFVARAPARS